MKGQNRWTRGSKGERNKGDPELTHRAEPQSMLGTDEKQDGELGKITHGLGSAAQSTMPAPPPHLSEERWKRNVFWATRRARLELKGQSQGPDPTWRIDGSRTELTALFCDFLWPRKIPPILGMRASFWRGFDHTRFLSGTREERVSVVQKLWPRCVGQVSQSVQASWLGGRSSSRASSQTWINVTCLW